MLDTIRELGIQVMHDPAMLCKHHGCFAWGRDAMEAVMNAGVLEEVARMARFTRQIRPDAAPAPEALRDKHFFRKHGEGAYYGQK